jgi:hypothetical protein
MNAAAIGAAYAAAARMNMHTRFRTRESLLDDSVVLRTGGNIYRIFNKGDSEEKNPVTRIRVGPRQMMEIVDESHDGEVFLRFTVDDVSRPTDVEISFMQNLFLMPVPIRTMVGQREVRLSFENCGWEVSDGEVEEAKREMRRRWDERKSGWRWSRRSEDEAERQREDERRARNEERDARRDPEKDSLRNELTRLLNELERNAEDSHWFSLRRWRIKHFTGELWNWLRDHRNLATVRMLTEKIEELKRFMGFLTENPRSEKEELLAELKDLIVASEMAGQRTDDIKAWVERNGDSASIADIKDKIQALERRNSRFGGL